MEYFKRTRFLLDILFIFLITVNHCSSETMGARKALKDKLLNGYDKLIRPTEEGENVTTVIISLMPQQMIELDEDRGIFKMDSLLYIAWKDDRLKWNRSVDYGGVYLPLPPDLLWLPDISVYNSHSLSVSPMVNVLLQVKYAGNVVWVPPIFTQTSCGNNMDSKYTSQEVECEIQLGAWAHDGWEIDYVHGSLLWHFLENTHPRWEIVVSKSRTNHVTYDFHEQYASLNFYFSLKRRSVPELEVTRNPCILVMLITLSVFWLSPDSTKKLHLLGILLLVLTVLLIYLACNTKRPLGVLAAVHYLQSSLYIVATTFLLQVLVIFKLCSLTGPARPPAIAVQLLTGPLRKYLFLHSPSKDYRIGTTEASSAANKNPPTPKDDWLLFAAGLDKLFFILTSVSIVVIHCL